MTHDPNLEMAVLGALLVSQGQAVDAVSGILGGSGEAFEEPRNGLLYETMLELHRHGRMVDPVLVAEFLGARLEDIGGPQYLASLFDAVPTSANAAHYAGLVRDRAALRGLRTACKRIAAESENANDPGGLLEEAEQEIFRLTQTRNRGADAVPVFHAMPDALAHFRLMADPEKRGGADGLPTGLPGLDGLLGGLRPGELVIVGARPACGKTALLLNVAAHLAEARTPCLFFSLEMGRDQIARRLLSMRGKVDPWRLHWRNGGGLERAEEAAKIIEPWPLWIDDHPRRSVWDIRGMARRWKARNGHKPGVIFLDYLQLCQLEKRAQKLQQRYVEIGEISHSLKALARELACPVVVAAQLSRTADAESDPFRMLACLRESGDIEADADAVIVLSRLGERDRKELGADSENIVRMGLVKHRHGATGIVNLFFDKPVQTFRALTVQQEPRRKAGVTVFDPGPEEDNGNEPF